MQKSPGKSISILEQRLGYQFNGIEYLEQALTHRSKQSHNNERLEFLGDSVLGFVIASELYHHFPKAKEGQLSRCRATLVKGVTLAQVAKQLELGEYLRLGPGELKSGGFRRESTLADAFEAIIGAICLDGGLDAAKSVIRSLFAERLARLDLKNVLKDPKTQLQEYLQARKCELPVYQVTETQGQDHQQSFRVQCMISLLNEAAQGEGSSRRKAEQCAAEAALKMLQFKKSEKVGSV